MRGGIMALAILMAAAGALAGEAEAARRTLRVGVYENPPFVQRKGNNCSGMALELWEAAAARLGVTSEYSEYASLRELLTAARDHRVDVCVANLAVTAERAQEVLFTFPWYDSGLRIMVRSQAHRGAWRRLVENGHVYAYASLFVLFMVVALATTLVRRRHDDDFPQTWRDGFTTCLRDVISIAKSGELPSRRPTWLRNLLVSAWMIFGMAILAYITSTVASAMTMAAVRDRGAVRGFADLPGRKVAVLSGSAAETYLGRLGVQVVGYGLKEDAAAALVDGEVEGVVADSAVLEYYAAQHPEQNLTLTGDLFHPYKFAFAVAPALPALADEISVRIIELHEEGEVARLRSKFFGAAQPGAAPASSVTVEVPPLLGPTLPVSGAATP